MADTPARKKERTRRARGTGTVFRDAETGVWVGRRIAGRRPDGSPRYVERRHADQAEMLRRLEAAAPPGPEVTVRQFASRWLEEMTCRPNTAKMRRNSVEAHILPVLGGIRLASLTVRQIEAACVKWSAAGLMANSVRLVVSHLHTMLAEAVREGIRGDNPARGARKPKSIRAKIDPFTGPELSAIIAAATDWPAGRILALLAGSGCRIGEALALDCGDFDPSGPTVQIERTQDLARQLGPPKSVHSVRLVELPAAVVPALVAARGGRTSGPLFATSAGGRGSHDQTRKTWVIMCRRLGLRFRNLHQLRHSVATLLISNGLPIGDAARHLGDTAETIVRTYLHATGASVGPVLNRVLVV